jgi:hypothetical protein
VRDKRDVLLFAQSTKGVEQDLPGAIRKSIGELREHDSWPDGPKGEDTRLDLGL